jgi:hypothetical protein
VGVVVMVIVIGIVAAVAVAATRASTSSPPAAVERSSGGEAAMKCLRCQTDMRSLGVEKFRVGGSSGGWKLVFGEWAELGEDMLAFEVLVCPSCRHVELFAAER